MANDRSGSVVAILSIILALEAPCDCFLTEKTLMFGAFTNNIQVFIDGINCSFGLSQYTSWPTIYSVEIPSMARIVALSVQAKSIAWPSALIAFIANTSVVSGYSWKCKKDSAPGLWAQPSFNDSLWSPGPVADSDLVDLLMTLFGEQRCTVCDPTASWLGYINILYPIKFYCRVHLPVEEVPTTRTLQTVTFRAQTDVPGLAFLLAERGVVVSSPPLTLCVHNTRSGISCARLCVRQKAYCVGFQYGGPDNVCCPLDDFVLTNALRSPAIGVNIWLRAS